MDETLNNFTVFKSYLEACSELPEPAKSACMWAILNYGMYGIEPDFSGLDGMMAVMAKAVFIATKPNINSSRKRSSDGSTGGRGKKKSLVEEEEKATEQIDDSTSSEIEKDAFETDKGGFCNIEKGAFDNEERGLSTSVKAIGIGEGIGKDTEREKDKEPEAKGESEGVEKGEGATLSSRFNTPMAVDLDQIPNQIFSLDSDSDSDSVFISLVLNDKTEFDIHESLITDLQELYPCVDVKQELRSMSAWCLMNEKRRKTKTGIKKFINSWLSNSQNSGNRKGESVTQEDDYFGYTTERSSIGADREAEEAARRRAEDKKRWPNVTVV